MEDIRGSVWRKWDLHVHTAASYDSDYNGPDANKLLVKAWKKNDIQAVAITDHFLIDADKIKDIRLLAPEIKVFPGVELRCDKGSPNLHMILIFSDLVDIDELANKFKVIMIDEKAKNKDDNDKIYWDFNDIVEFANNNDALISAHTGKKDKGMDKEITSALPVGQAIKTEISQYVHIYEIGQMEDVIVHKEKIFPHIGDKPLILCSDNHDPRNYKIKIFTWIKADLTFDGLKQIVFEPDERVKIQSHIPDEKAPYHVIDRVEINDSNFLDTPIYFNENLTCIIGGKSTGKSLLLHNIAMAIDENQVKDKIETANTNIRPIDNFKVIWKDNEKSFIGNESDSKKIIYIPQTYLNQLSDSKENTTEIDEIIKNVLQQDSEIKKAYDELIIKEDDIKKNTDGLIYDLVSYIKTREAYISELKELGGKEGIEKNVEKLKGEKDILMKNSNIDQNDINEFNRLKKNKIEIDEEIKNLNNDINALKIEPYYFDDDYILNFTEMFSEEISHSVETFEKDMEEKWKISTEVIKKKILKNIDDKKKKLSTINQKIKELEPKINVDEKIKDIAKKLEKEESTLKAAEEFYTLINDMNNEIEKSKNDIIASKEKYKVIIEQFISIVNSRAISDDEMVFVLSCVFKQQEFQKNINSVFNKTTFSRFDKELLKNFAEESYNNNEIMLNLISHIEKNNTSSLQLVKGFNKEDALRVLFSNMYNIDFSVKLDDDIIYEMSPGKKALVLLKLLINMAESKCPILIDQPEDDLDNRSIFSDLIEYIKIRKRQRQIIVVTHNANIVVGGDSEGVIVANQQGKNSPNEGFKFEYRIGSIENDISHPSANGILKRKGIKTHICEILEGGEHAFHLRGSKYFKKL